MDRFFLNMFTTAVIFKGVLFAILCVQSVKAEIVEAREITEILSSIDESTLVLFDLDGTIMDSGLSLNSSNWIKLYWQIAPDLVKDVSLVECLMQFVTERVPVKPVESITPQIVSELQKKAVTLALTARSLEDEHLTVQQLNSIGVDFGQFGIIFTSGQLKGEYLIKLFEDINYRPNRVIFLDDKLEQVTSLDRVMQESGIPCKSFWYRRESSPFNPMLAMIQLDHLVNRGDVLNDQQASALEESYADFEIRQLLQEIIKKYEIKYCN